MEAPHPACIGRYLSFLSMAFGLAPVLRPGAALGRATLNSRLLPAVARPKSHILRLKPGLRWCLTRSRLSTRRASQFWEGKMNIEWMMNVRTRGI